MNAQLPFQPVIILGAARSGTNLLRDLLCSFQGVETWPCDEINAIWRHGNLNWPNDEFPSRLATSPVRKYIRHAFFKQWQRTEKPPILIEKTCANSLRVPFVSQVFPEAKYIHIIRNGMDVIPSAERRWLGEFELPILKYYIAKLRFVPLGDLFHYAVRFAENRISRKGLSSGFKYWGPQSSDIQGAQISLHDRCALQWASCVMRCADGLEKIDATLVRTIHYEDLVSQPFDQLAQLGRFLDLEISQKEMSHAIHTIRQPKQNTASIIPQELIKPLRRFGYL